jgi:hypothetical protein
VLGEHSAGRDRVAESELPELASGTQDEVRVAALAAFVASRYRNVS